MSLLAREMNGHGTLSGLGRKEFWANNLGAGVDHAGHPRLDDEHVMDEVVAMPTGFKCSSIQDGMLQVLPAALECFLAHPATMHMALEFRDAENAAMAAVDAPKLILTKVGNVCCCMLVCWSFCLSCLPCARLCLAPSPAEWGGMGI